MKNENEKMKKTSTLLLVLFTVYSFGQVKDSTSTEKVSVEFYLGFGVQIQDDLNINKKLRESNLPEVQNTIPEFNVGIDFMGKKYSGVAEFGFLYSETDKNDYTNKSTGFTGRLKLHYNLVNKNKIAFTTGLNIASTNNVLDIYSKSNTIDLNNLNPNNNSHLNIKNQMFYVGPSISLYLFRKSFPIKINAGYEIAFTRGKWKSDFGSVINTVKEINNNRFIFGVTLL